MIFNAMSWIVVMVISLMCEFGWNFWLIYADANVFLFLYHKITVCTGIGI